MRAKLYKAGLCVTAAAFGSRGYRQWDRREVCFSVIWETKSRYIYPYAVMAIPCVAVSLVYYYDHLPDFVKKHIDKIKKIGGKNHV